MKYFLDTEFLEGSQKTFFGQSKPTIDLISIGIISELGDEYYAISKDFNLKEAWDRWQPDRDCSEYEKEYWIRENVLMHIHYELSLKEANHNLKYDKWRDLITQRENGNYGDRHFKTLKKLLNKYGKTNAQIAFEVLNFVHGYNDIGNWLGTLNEYYQAQKKSEPKELVEFYAYYGAYDWVAFCWIFGKMIDLPKGFHMYCRDLKQILDEKEMARQDGTDMVELRNLPTYPKQENEHNALADAKWNKELYYFLNTLY